jgi:anaerobic selenocysteine-containing dehydrogenase
MNKQYTKTTNSLRDEKTSDPSSGTEIRPTICSICNPGSHCGVDAYVKNGRIINLYISNGVKTRDGEFMQSCSWSEMAPRVGEDKHPVWCRFIPEAHSMMVPFQFRSQKPYPIRAMLAFGLNHRMWPGSDFARESFKKLDFLVDVDLFMTDTAKLADVVLPACSSYERSELKFYPEKRIHLTSRILPMSDRTISAVYLI